MNVAVTAGSNAAITAALIRKKTVQHFEKAGAFSAETAVPLPPKPSRHMVNALIKQKVIVPAGDDLFYLDVTANERALRQQLKAGMVAVLLLAAAALAVVALVLLFKNGG